MKVIIDCNVIISAGIKSGNCREILDIIIADHECFISPEIEAEYLKTIMKPYLLKYTLLPIIVKEVISNARSVAPASHDFRLRHSKDEKYLAAAIAANADIIITGDKDFTEPYYGNVKIMRPDEFFDLFVK